MKAFFTDDQLLHDPQQYMRVGRICKPTDLPSRAHALRDALAGRGIALASPPDVGRAPLEAVHSTDYLDYLEEALQRIEAGTYGLCRTCKGPIGRARLEAVPTATQCIACKKKEGDSPKL